MARFPQQKAVRGSQRWIQVLVNEKPEMLNRAIALGHIKWLSPLASDQYAEYRDKAFLRLLDIELKHRPLAHFWPPGGPQWDALGISDSGEAILVEAKAHIQEIFSPPSQATAQSLALIKRSLDETSLQLRAVPGPDWSRRFYQYANRLAHAFLLQELNHISTRLVFVCFTGDRQMNGPEANREWEAALEVLHEALGLRGRLPSYVTEVFVDVRDI